MAPDNRDRDRDRDRSPDRRDFRDRDRDRDRDFRDTRDTRDTANTKETPKNNAANKDRIVVSQPATDVWEYENHWQKNFTDCCEDCKICCFAWCCPMCFLGKLFSRTGECCCMFCIPCSLMSLRSKLRTGFRIKGSLCRDCVAVNCCPLCAAIQMHMELDKQEL